MTSSRVLLSDSLEGRRGIVTGAGSGIGRVIAHRFIELGAYVVGIGRTADHLEETRRTSADPTMFEWITCNVRDQSQVSETITSIGEKGGLDLLVNCAGGQFIAPATAITPNGWRSVHELNLDAIFWTCSAAYPYLAHSGRGAIVNIVLSGVERGSMGMAHSVSARAGVVGLTRTLAQEWGPKRIRVNCVGPGLVITTKFQEYSDASVVDRIVIETPMGRPTEADEVAELIAYLSCDASVMITGQLLQIDGGASLSHGLHMLGDPVE